MNTELLMVIGALLLFAVIGILMKWRFLVRLGAGAVALSIMLKIAEFRGWEMDQQTILLMYVAASTFGYMFGFLVPPNPVRPPRQSQ